MSIIPTLKERRAFNEKRRRSREGVSLTNIHHPEGDGVVPEGLNPDSLETIEIEIPMNIKQLAEQVGAIIHKAMHGEAISFLENDLERFAELVRQDECDKCAKLLDDFAKTQMVPAKDTWRMGVMAAANAVRDKK